MRNLLSVIKTIDYLGVANLDQTYCLRICRLDASGTPSLPPVLCLRIVAELGSIKVNDQ
jgi:hypothetical protein